MGIFWGLVILGWFICEGFYELARAISREKKCVECGD